MTGERTMVRRASEATEPEARPDGYYRIRVWGKWCKGCGLCIAFCPKQVFEEDDQHHPIVAHPEQCIGCQWCAIHCPDFAILVEEVGSPEEMVAK